VAKVTRTKRKGKLIRMRVIDNQSVPDDFKDYPVGIKEAKAQSVTEWTCREALLSALRDIDSGKITPTAFAVAWTNLDENGEMDWGYSASTQTNRLELLGMLTKLINRLM
jgi:hypothetical protein